MYGTSKREREGDLSWLVFLQTDEEMKTIHGLLVEMSLGFKGKETAAGIGHPYASANRNLCLIQSDRCLRPAARGKGRGSLRKR